MWMYRKAFGALVGKTVGCNPAIGRTWPFWEVNPNNMYVSALVSCLVTSGVMSDDIEFLILFLDSPYSLTDADI